MSKLKTFLLLGTASAFTFCGSALIGLSLGLDSWRGFTDIRNSTRIDFIQGLLRECKVYPDRIPKQKECYSWTKSSTLKLIAEYQEILLYLTGAASTMGFLSILLSIGAMTSRLAKFVIPVTALELACVLSSLASLIIYTINFIKQPWSASLSYFALWSATICVMIGLILHTCVGDVKFMGKKCFVAPKPNYRYHKGTDSLLEM